MKSLFRQNRLSAQRSKAQSGLVDARRPRMKSLFRQNRLSAQRCGASAPLMRGGRP
jgi:hypothetical protein